MKRIALLLAIVALALAAAAPVMAGGPVRGGKIVIAA
jgi:hypothetical protein